MNNAEAAKSADTLIVAVKPQDMAALLDELAPHVAADRLVVTAAAGVPTSFFEQRLADGIAVVRVMPNTPVLVDEGMSVISAGSHATEAHLIRTEEIFNPVGKTLRVPESQQDAATALSGSGPAYFYYLVEAMTDAGILLGLPRAQAHDLIVQAAIGAAVDAPRQRRTPRQAARGRHLPGRHHDQRHPRVGEPRRTRRPARRPGSGPRPQPRAGLQQRLTARSPHDGDGFGGRRVWRQDDGVGGRPPPGRRPQLCAGVSRHAAERGPAREGPA